jgi:hypothetical protein
MLQYYTSTPKSLDPNVLIGLKIDVTSLQTIVDKHGCCISLMKTASRHRLSAMIGKLTPSIYNAHVGSGIKITGSDGLRIFVDSDATADQFKEHLELIDKIHNNDTSLGTPLPGWQNTGRGTVPLLPETPESPETQDKMAAAMRASLGEIHFIKDGMVDIGQRMASKDDIKGMGEAMQSTLEKGEAQTKEALKQSQDALKQSQDALKQSQDALKQSQDALKQSQKAEAKTQDALKQSQALHAEDKEKNSRQTFMLCDLNKQLTNLRTIKAKQETENAKLKTELEGLRTLQAMQEDIRVVRNILEKAKK